MYITSVLFTLFYFLLFFLMGNSSSLNQITLFPSVLRHFPGYHHSPHPFAFSGFFHSFSSWKNLPHHLPNVPRQSSPFSSKPFELIPQPPKPFKFFLFYINKSSFSLITRQIHLFVIVHRKSFGLFTHTSNTIFSDGLGLGFNR